MATLQRFKLMMFATQCTVAQSPTRSPATSPLVTLRRQKTTLRMLLSRRSSDLLPPRGSTSPSHDYSKTTATNQPSIAMTATATKQKKNGNSKLKDLFVSASSPEHNNEVGDVAAVMKVSGLESVGSIGSGWTGFRFRHRMLLRKAWRPLLVTIPEEF